MAGDGLPRAPIAPAPNDGRGAAAAPAAYVAPTHQSPPIRRHALPLCALTGIFGGIPSEAGRDDVYGA